MFSSQATSSPSKVTVPSSRKQRNQQSSRVHDIEFATEISTSLLAQVRQLQALLAEREQSLKDISLEKSSLELEAEAFTQRIRALDESEQRYKDENWALETQTHELLAAGRDAQAREDRLTSNVNTLTSEKNKVQRELDELRQSHGRLAEDSTATQKSLDSEIHILRRNVTLGDSERNSLQQKIEELTSQNQELATAVTIKLRQHDPSPVRDPRLDEDDGNRDDKTPENSPPPSPNKPTPRHNHLETETLKSSLHHAHRMIQNLKNNIHREKTEKLELKRMLQEARDEVEQRRSEPAAPLPKRQRTKTDAFKKPPRPDKLGASRREVTKVIEPEPEPEWEDHLTDTSPVRPPPLEKPSTPVKSGGFGVESASASDAYHTANETEDAFETANEREITTESEAFQTGVESPGESSEELTETEDRSTQFGSVRRKKPSVLSLGKPGDRSSFMSTASTSADEDDHRLRTPVQAQPHRYRVRMTRGRPGHSYETSADSGGEALSPRDSPASFNSPPQRAISGGQSLFAELSGFGNGSDSEFGTPGPESQVTSPTERRLEPSQAFDTLPPARQLLMVDSGMMTEPWEPQVNGEQTDSQEQYSAIDAGSQVDKRVSADSSTQCTPTKPSFVTSEPTVILDTPPKMAWDSSERLVMAGSDLQQPLVVPPEPLQLELSPIAAEATSPVLPKLVRRDTAQLAVSSITFQATTPVSPPAPKISTAQLAFSSVSSSSTTPVPPVQHTPDLTLSPVKSVATEPVAPAPPAPVIVPVAFPETKSFGFSPLRTEETRPITPVVTRPSLTPQSVVLYPDSGVEDSPDRPTTAVRETKSIAEGYTPFDTINEEQRNPVAVTSAAGTQTENRVDTPQVPRDDDVHVAVNCDPVSPAKSTDGGAQTTLTGTQIDQLLVSRAARPISPTETKRPPLTILQNSPTTATATTPKARPVRPGASPVPTPPAWRPTSAGSQARSTISHPSLPVSHRQSISGNMSPGPMGPPIAPASAYRSASQRPHTPSEQAGLRNGNMSRARAQRTSQMSRRSSLSSFASELEGRFNMDRPQYGFDQGADPRMIQAITQTMIGEFLWKYTRKAGRPEMSNTRHRRYFWVHPYTRTLYWSLHDPQAAGKSQLKAKSVAIEAVRVVTDENPYPPGLHQKSLEIVSPGRVVKFTAATSQRHDTWLNALSYLLLRTAGDEEDEGEDPIEFTPYRNSSRQAESRRSVSLSHHSRTANTLSRNYVEGTLRTPRQPATPGAKSPSIASSRPSSTLRAPPGPRQSSVSRISSMFRNSAVMGTLSGRRSRTDARDSIDSASEVSRDSVEDLRRVERQPPQLENVRACCDGEFILSACRLVSCMRTN